VSAGRIAAARASLADALAPLGDVYDVLPERFTPPAVLLVPDEPWITTAGRPARIGDLHYTAILVVRPGANDAQEQAITSRVEQALDALEDPAHAWIVETVTAPYDLAVAGTVYLAVKLTVSLTARITTE
jgi:hypothetical protein